MDVALLGEIKELLSVYGGGIKSIQRGVWKNTLSKSSASNSSKSVTISTVNPDRCSLSVCIDGYTDQGMGSAYYTPSIIGATLNADSITFKNYDSYPATASVTWQVIEHY